MPVTFTNVAGASTGSSSATQTIADVDLLAGRLHLLVCSANGPTTAALGNPTATQSGATWALVAAQSFSNFNRRTVAVFRCQPASGLTADLTVEWPEALNDKAMSVDMSSSGVHNDTAGNGAGCIGQAVANTGNSATLGVTLAAFLDPDNATFAAGAAQGVSNYSAGSGFTLVSAHIPPAAISQASQAADEPILSPTMTRDDGAQNWAMIGLEVLSDGSPPPEPAEQGLYRWDGANEVLVPVAAGQVVGLSDWMADVETRLDALENP